MHDLFTSESSVNWCGNDDALVHYSTIRPLLIPPTVRTSLTDYNSVTLTYLITTQKNTYAPPKIYGSLYMTLDILPTRIS